MVGRWWTGLARRALAVLLAASVLVGPRPAGAQARPARVVSLNLCADQLLLRLAEREQIASLSPLSRDPTLSFLAVEAQAVPLNEGRGEAILFAGADLVLAGRFGSHTKRELLQRHGLEVLVLDPWRSLAQGREQIRTVAARLGHPERGESLIGEIDAALARTKDLVPQGRTLLTYHRRGWVPGPDSLTGEIARHIGFTLHQERLGLARGGLVRLETVVAAPPDYGLMDGADTRAVDNGSALLVHPALADALPPARRLTIADNLMLCGGPSTPAAIDALAAEVRAKVR
jgi:iron complex transport system substrate-binding protein